MKTLLATLLFVATGASTVQAVPPTNDDVDDAVEIFSLPFSDTVDTTEATTADDDPDCSGQGPTVWYAFTAFEDVRIEANTFGSDYDTTLSVYTGMPGALDQLACNDDSAGDVQSRVRFDAITGETYFFMVGAFSSGPGGTLQFSVDETSASLPPTIDLSIDPVGRFIPRTGEAVISGTLVCSEPVSADVFLDLRQDVGRFIIRGSGFTSFECEGETAWSATVTSETGLFRGGPAKVEAFAGAFDPDTDEFVQDDALAAIRLRGGGR